MKFSAPALRRLLPIIVGLLAGAWSGCSSIQAPKVKLERAAAPPLAAATSLPRLADEDPRRGLVLSEAGRFTEPAALKFFAAREAYWNHDTDAAVKLLRELQQEKIIEPDHFYDLVYQCYAHAGRWADLRAFYGEFGLEETRAGQVRFAKFMAGLPVRHFAFAGEAPSLPMTLRFGTWIVVDANINGRPARVLLDTGANLTWLSERFARRAGVEIFAQTISLHDANDRVRPTPIALVNELQLGGLTVRNAPVLAGRSLMMEFGAWVDGVIGWDILQHADITWDFVTRQMTLAAPNGPVIPEPKLAGRIAPIFTVVSPTGGRLNLFLDTGARGNNRNALTLYDNDGVLATKLSLTEFHPSWLPTVQGGFHSVAVKRERRMRPFTFWMDGVSFELPGATLNPAKTLHRQEHLVLLDGVVGNGPFLGGRLRICGVRREIAFEPSPSKIRTATIAAKQGMGN